MTKSPLEIIFQPKSIVGLLVAVGLLFLLIGGLTIPMNQDVSGFFLIWGGFLFVIGLIGWLCFFIPAVARNWGR